MDLKKKKKKNLLLVFEQYCFVILGEKKIYMMIFLKISLKWSVRLSSPFLPQIPAALLQLYAPVIALGIMGKMAQLGGECALKAMRKISGGHYQISSSLLPIKFPPPKLSSLS
ncbi:UNVERIFIED_CONTAM: hypothetical protein K2H54_045235 [Gekko kuhli]